MCAEPRAAEQDGYRYRDAIRDALDGALSDDPGVWLAGIDVGPGGNVFGLTAGLHERNPGRLLDTPISETAIAGLAVGGAMAGTRPVIEIMYLDFIGTCFDQLLNQAAKLPFMTDGRAQMALVVRTQFGSGKSSAAQHSQSLEAMLAHIPGLTVVMPSTPSDAYGLLRARHRGPQPGHLHREPRAVRTSRQSTRPRPSGADRTRGAPATRRRRDRGDLVSDDRCVPGGRRAHG